MKIKAALQQAFDFIQTKLPVFNASVGMILGSGLGCITDDMTIQARIPYHEIPGFCTSEVDGHASELVFGEYQGVSVVCMSGRIHLYEGADFAQVALPIRLMKLLGVKHLLISNAAGSLISGATPGDVVMIKDHINFQINSPLVGPNDNDMGPRFVPMENAYDAATRHKFNRIAVDFGIEMHEGVYIGVLGPQFETPAEIRAFKLLGADLVGMSTVPEVIVARHCGLKVTAISAVTNMASGVSSSEVNHDDVLKYAAFAVDKIKKIWQVGITML